MNLYHTESESMVIGGLLLDPEVMDEICEVIKPEDFWDTDNRLVFETVQDMTTAGEPVDLFLIADKLEKITRAEWAAKLAKLAKNSTGSRNVKPYAVRVSEYAKLRSLYQAGVLVQEISLDHSYTLTERLNRAQDAVLSSVSEEDAQTVKTRRQLAIDWIDHLDECRAAKGGLTGLSTGLKSFDDRTNGLGAGGLYVIAARPAMGKTNLALNIAANIVYRQNKNVLIFSLEMPSHELFSRICSEQTHMDYKKVRSADFDTGDQCENWRKVKDFAGAINSKGLFVHDPSSITMPELVSVAKRHHRMHGVDLIIIDYVQLIDTMGAENETIAIGNITKGLKALAKRLKVPILILSQLNRAVDGRADKRPMMSDIRSSGQIEQDADAIAFIYREAAYPETMVSGNDDIAEIVWRKVRAGETGTDYLQTQFHQCRFVDTERTPKLPDPKQTKPFKRGMDL